jgi:hypothetical protein
MNFNNDDFNIVQSGAATSFDPVEVLHGTEKLPGQEDDDDDEEDEEEEEDDSPKQKNPKTVKSNAPKTFKPSGEGLTDEMLEEGLMRARAEANGETYKPPVKKAVKPAIENEEDDEEDEDELTPKNEFVPDEDNSFAIHYQAMVAAGRWEPDEEFEKNPTEEGYEAMLDKTDAARAINVAQSYFNNAFKKNPEGAQQGMALLNHLKAGGRVSDFVELYAGSDIDFDALESDDDDTALEAAREIVGGYYQELGWKPEKVKKKVAELEKTGRLVDEGKEIREPYEDMIAHNQELNQRQLDQQAAAQTQARKKLNTGIKELIEKTPSFGSVPLYKNEKEKREFDNFIFAADDSGLSQYNKEFNAALKHPSFIALTAAILKHKLHEKPELLGATGKAKKEAASEATSGLRKKLNEALLNKGLGSKADQSSVSKKSSSGYKFDLDQALVLR